MTSAAALTIRVWIPDVWDIVSLTVTPDWTVHRLKQEALRIGTGRSPDSERFVIKLRGWQVLDEAATLADLGVPDHVAFIVLPAHRQPVR